MASSTRLTSVASGAFFLAYLGVQLVYPAMAWVRPGYEHFTWHMYSGLHDRPDVVVVFADGTTRDLGLLTRRDSPVRVLGPSVDLGRFVPPRLCAIWPDAREVRLRTRDRETVVPCSRF
jgi:hypothetical protein